MERYIKGSANRQDFLKTALEWISRDDNEAYMSKYIEMMIILMNFKIISIQ
ncbi:hypothetical protein AKUA1805_TOXIN100130 (plasmid) [Apilactobacillus kunkeei]|nr:hypothetical protein AKUA1805_TOXIN100130 [Apilactobacillus kunkeei]